MAGTELHSLGTGLMNNVTYVGLDVHKATVCMAVAESGRSGEVRQVGVFENHPESPSRMAARLGKSGRRLSFCYEAGPCGYGLHRLLTGCGHSRVVVAPSPIPMKTGDRVKTDRRDAMMLAKLRRAGELTRIWIPDAAHEEMRDLVRACENAPNRGSNSYVERPRGPSALWRRMTRWERCGHMYGLSARSSTAGLDEVRDARG